MKRLFVGFGAVLVGAVSFVLLSSRPVMAVVPAAQGLQLSPVVINLNADKANTYNLKISITNVTTGELVFSSGVNDFTAKDESGDPQVELGPSTLPSTASVTSWVQPIGQIDLKSGEKRTLNVAVVVPPGAEAGGHYGVIRFSGRAPGAPNNSVSLAASAGVLLLVRVSGNITENLTLASFVAQQNGHPQSWFTHGPIDFVERTKNSGNVHVAPTGNLTVTNMFGHTVGSLNVNSTKGNVLPSSIRRFQQTFNKKWLFGKYKASVNLAYGTSGKVLTNSISFWVIPWMQIFIAVAILIVVILLFRFMIGNYNRSIIKKSQKSGKKPRKK